MVRFLTSVGKTRSPAYLSSWQTYVAIMMVFSLLVLICAERLKIVQYPIMSNKASDCQQQQHLRPHVGFSHNCRELLLFFFFCMGGTSCTDSTGVDQYYCITPNYSASVYCGRYRGQYSETITFGDTVTFARFHETRAGRILCVCGYSGPETLALIDAMCLSASREVSCDTAAKSDCLIIKPQDVGKGKVKQLCT